MPRSPLVIAIVIVIVIVIVIIVTVIVIVIIILVVIIIVHDPAFTIVGPGFDRFDCVGHAGFGPKNVYQNRG